MLDPSDWYEVSFVNSDGPWGAIRARLSITDEERSFVSVAFRVVTRDVDLLLGVEGVLKSRVVEEFVSHGDGGRKGRVERQGKTKRWGRSTYLTEAMGRLCALVRAQLVRVQHADAAPGAGESERLCQRSPSCAAHCRPI
ncbi:hypothetical protein POSPLADRAFT_1129807 [Postia placenta MAD-698-R-SB12]|uniref:Uncharacterized protein n=1 Tax=Postia placenta MAD-698-R-SB12 TaxID=670580 RepID=A0A1X6NH65_9APHY|nr:hypothetical protein POSPLADRAFT_1129807 [Postia placenta MAD-698-R-SB12]OSX67977.1 hypothetical protein POSPLADRAFT_1129807 [Postia placenta MAD-698-R-SB12]